MLSKNRKKLIRSLARKKIRQAEGLFIAEGEKLLDEILKNITGSARGYRLHSIVGTPDWIEARRDSLSGEYQVIECDAAELKKVSLQQTPNRVLAILHMPPAPEQESFPGEGLVLGLSRLQDPGNLGSILRVADWFGIRDVYCSPDSVDQYNPKVIQSSMGSFLRVRVNYLELEEAIRQLRSKGKFSIYAGGIEGMSLFESQVNTPAMILLGNESQGLQGELVSLADKTLSIPFHDPLMHSESLNVATAAAVFCAEFRRPG